MNTVELSVYVDSEWQDFLIAELDELDFDGFYQESHLVKAYIPAESWDEVKREHVETWLRSHGLLVPVEESTIPGQNWNRQWEETIRPIAIGGFLVKPTWAEVPEEYADKILLEIDPKMSFGTGYHESTRLVLRFLPDLVRQDMFVMDAGTGTGILAIAAIKLGAERAVAFDNDPWAQENAVENFYLNGVQNEIAFRSGDLGAVPEEDFDLILANINRNILLEMLPSFNRKLVPTGSLVLAGLLIEDRPQMLEAAQAEKLVPVKEATEGLWWSVVFQKT